MGKSNIEQLHIAEQYLGDSCPTCCHMANNCCCYFVSHIFAEAKNASLFYGGKTVLYVPNAKKWCSTNLAEIPIYLAMPSDIVVFDWNLNGEFDHIGFVDHRVSDQVVATLEGNTTKHGIVAKRNRTVKYVKCYRPQFKGEFDASKKLEEDGAFEYNSIAVMQKWLGVKVDGILGRGTVKALQKKLGVKADGAWGKKTSKALQKLIGVKTDGWFGEDSVKALQRYLNKHAFKDEPPKKQAAKKPTVEKPKKPTKAEKIVTKAEQLCWAYKTPKEKWQYSTGNATKAYRKVTKGASRVTRSDCGYFVKKLLKKSLGINYNPLDWKAKVPKDLERVWHGKAIPKGFLEAGDIVAYKTTSGQHTLVYMGKGLIAEAGRKHRFPVIRKSRKYNASRVKKKTIVVYRAK